MADKTNLNPMLQMLAALRTQQNGAALNTKATQDSAPDASISFSQALKSATNRSNADGAAKPLEAKGASENKPSEPPATDTTAAATQTPDGASQAALALLALQVSLGKATSDQAAKGMTEEAVRLSTLSDASAQPDAAAAAQALALVMPATAQIAAPSAVTTNAAAIPAKLAAEPATVALAPASSAIGTPSARTTELSNSLSASASVVAPSTAEATQSSDGQATADGSNDKGKDLLAGQRSLIDTTNLRSRDASQEPSATTPSNTFSAELNNAQAAYGIKTEARLETQASQTQYTVNTPVNAHNWAAEVGARVSWIANKDNGRADLVLNPPHMGKIEVSINLSGDQASASFTAANPSTREALQDALPRLREVLADAGIQLGQANVSAGGSGQAQADQNSARSSTGWLAADTSSGEVAIDSIEQRVVRSNGLVDLFA